MNETPPSCPSCGEGVRPGAGFCGRCGAKVVLIEAALDVEPIRHLEVGAQGLLRLRIDNRGAAIATARVTFALDGQPHDAVEVGALATEASAEAHVLWTPSTPGFHAFMAVIAADAITFTAAVVHLRVGGEKQPVSITIDQSSARVVDNSRSQFGVIDSGGILGAGEWQPLALTRVSPPAPRPLPARPEFAPVSFAIQTVKGIYDLDETIARGDLATVFGGRERGAGKPIVLKLVDDSRDNDLALLEVETLGALHADADAQSPARHLPVVVDRMKTGDGRIGTVLERIDGFDLVELRRRLAARGEPGLSPRHLMWLMRRVLATLGWAHARGILHGNLDPAHILVRPHDHMVWVVDWCWAIVNPAKTGQTFKAKNEVFSPPEVAERRPPLPASDLYALGKCMFFVAGGDPVAKTLPEHPDLDERVVRFLRFMVTESARGRPQDAVALYTQVEKLREQVWGPHTFVPLDV